MIQGNVANYTSDATHKMTYDGSSAITITFKLAPLVSYKNVPVFENDWQSITGGTVANADLDQWHWRDIKADTVPAGFIKFQFSDGTNDYESNYIAIEGAERISLFIKVFDLTSEVGFDAIIQAA
jgi:hypothetical protein